MNKRLLKTSLIIITIVGLVAGVWWLNRGATTTLQTKPKLVIGTDPGFKPFEYRQGGKIVGFDIDLAQEIANDTGRQLVIEEMNFDGLIAALQAGKIDMAVAGMSVTPERSQNVNFSNPYYLASQMIVVRDNDQRIKIKTDLTGKKIGVQLGSTGDTIVGQLPHVTKIQFSAVPAVLQEPP